MTMLVHSIAVAPCMHACMQRQRQCQRWMPFFNLYLDASATLPTDAIPCPQLRPRHPGRHQWHPRPVALDPQPGAQATQVKLLVYRMPYHGHFSLSLRLQDSLVEARYVSGGMQHLGRALMTRHAGCLQDTETGPVPVVADQIYIYRDPTCTNKAVSKVPYLAVMHLAHRDHCR